MHYYKHHIGDFRSGTANMTRQERWLYRDMLDVYYDKEVPLPTSVQDVCDQIGATDEEAHSVAKILRLKFNQTETGWVHDRCEKELESYRASAEQARKNGKLGGRPPKNTSKKTRPVINGFQSGSQQEPAGGPEESGSQANHKPLTTNHKPLEDQNHSLADAQGIVLERRADVVEAIADEAPAALVASKASQARMDFGDDVRAVFSYWQRQRGHDRAKLDDKRAKAIRARLKDGYTVDDLCRAVEGIAKSAHHMGANDARTVYDDIELICRTAVNVDKFAKLAGPLPALDHGLQHQVDVLNEWMRGE